MALLPVILLNATLLNDEFNCKIFTFDSKFPERCNKTINKFPGNASGTNSAKFSLSLITQNVEFDITVPPCKLYVKNLMSKKFDVLHFQ